MGAILWLDLLLTVLGASLIICFVRLYRGPNPPNRTVAFDVIALHAVGMMALEAMRYHSPVLLDAAIVTAVLGFVGTVMLARYLEQSDPGDWEQPESPGEVGAPDEAPKES